MKTNLADQEKTLYQPPRHPVLIDVPPMNFLMLDGAGAPDSARYQETVQALYSLAYGLKFHIKKNAGQDYRVYPLEGLWWVDDLSQLSMTERDNWKWTMMIRQPDLVTQELTAAMISEVIHKKQLLLAQEIRLETFAEGRAAQVMHIGPYSAELPTIELLHRFVAESGLQLRDKHHEIYLGDPRRTAPEKLRTVLRHPVEAIA